MEAAGLVMVEQERLITVGIVEAARISDSLIFQEEALLMATTGYMLSKPPMSVVWTFLVLVQFEVAAVEMFLNSTVAVIVELWRLGRLFQGKSANSIGAEKYQEEEEESPLILPGDDGFKLIVR
jgi:hypothetical protein